MSSLDPECVLLSGYDTVIDTTRLDAELSTTDGAVLEQSSRHEFGMITSSFLNLVLCSPRIDSRHYLSIVDGGRVV